MHGAGVRNFSDNTRYEGQFSNNMMHGMGSYLFYQGKRFFDGSWNDSCPVRGTAFDKATGTLYDASFDGTVSIEDGWNTDIWPAIGKVTNGCPGTSFGDATVWKGTIIFSSDNRKFVGGLRGLRPIEGIETDTDGRQISATFDGQKTLAYLAKNSKKVHIRILIKFQTESSVEWLLQMLTMTTPHRCRC